MIFPTCNRPCQRFHFIIVIASVYMHVYLILIPSAARFFVMIKCELDLCGLNGFIQFMRDNQLEFNGPGQSFNYTFMSPYYFEDHPPTGDEINMNSKYENSPSQQSTDEISTSSSSGTMSPNAALPSSVEMSFPENNELPVEAEGSFRWEIENYDKLERKSYSPTFRVGKYGWKLLFYPRGNESMTGESGSISLYLAIETDELNKDDSDSDWAVCAQIIFDLQKKDDNKIRIQKYTNHRFNSLENDWGFGQFCTLKTLLKGDTATHGLPIVNENGSFVIAVKIRVIEDVTGVLWHNFVNYNSKKITGCVGLANQGATCYMNSLLQSLFFTNAFRKSIYKIPTEGERPEESNALALQRIFWRLQYSDHPVSTQELTKAFGWDSLEAFIQSDVQEFSRVLMDELEKKMKGTEAEGSVEKLFVGKVRNVISCLNVPFSSKRTESFYDLQLTIKNLKNLEESFDNYVRVEMLDGDNKYRAEGYGLQDAKKFVEFEEFPPVLHLHLERYAFDPRVMATVKINDRLEFPLEISLDKYLAPDSPQRTQPQKFILQSVFVHSGDSHGGHYYVFIRDPRDTRSRWFRFDDTKVIPASQKEAVEDNFGGIDGEDEAKRTPSSFGARNKDKYKKFTNAYMLVYVRECDMDYILCPLNENIDIPTHVGLNIKAEEEAEKARRLEKHRQFMSINTKIFTKEMLAQHHSFDFYNFDNANLPISPSLAIQGKRGQTVAEFKELVAEKLAIESKRIRLWTFSPRRNTTIRLSDPIIDESNDLSHYQARDQMVLVLFAEVDGPALPEDISSGPLAMLFKFYDPEQSQLTPVTLKYVLPSANILSAQDSLRQLVGLPKNAQLEFYEEVKPGRIDRLDPNKTFADSQLGTGDIICFQISNPVYSTSIKLLKVSDYFRELQSMLRVVLRNYQDGSEIADTHFSVMTPYEDILGAISDKLQIPVTHIRLHLCDDLDDSIPIKSLKPKSSLQEVLSQYVLSSNVTTNGIVLLCERTDLAVSEIESMKRIRIISTDNHDQKEFMVYVGIKDTLRTLLARFPTDIKWNENVRLLEAHNHHIIRDYILDDSLAPISESSIIYFEDNVDPLELNPPSGYQLISVFSYWKEPIRVHSKPIRFLLIPGEPFHLTKSRLLSRFKAFNDTDKWGFSVVSYGRARLIGEEEILTNSGLRETDQLGINRPDPFYVAKPTLTSTAEQGIRIRSSTPKA